MDTSDEDKFEGEKMNEDSINYHSNNRPSSWQFGSTNFTHNPLGLVPIGDPIEICNRDLIASSWEHPLNSQNVGFGFIEREARFSCFNGGTFSDMVNPVSIPESTISCYQKNELHMNEDSKDGALHVETEATEENLHSNERGEIVLPSPDEAKECICASNGSDEAEFSGGGGMDGKPNEKEVGFKNKKRSGQETELHQVRSVKPHSVETEKDYTEIQHGGQNLSPNTNTGKHGKQRSQASGPPKDEYTHVRARRGQATNSHSLAERMRRGKITEREKLLQDLVPGCSKVKGKAVMLDEIINYVQSLQRQVEFLSMKLATVHPRLDFIIEDLLTKDILQARACPPSTSEFSPGVNMQYPQLHHPGAVNPDMGNYYHTFQETMNTQMKTLSEGYKGPSPMIPNAWEDEFPNVLHMGLGPGISSDTQDLNGSIRSSKMKVEP